MSVFSAIKKAWAALDYIPDCPSCGGTGDALPGRYDEIVFWKGRQVRVCGQCNGAGKV